MMLLLQSAPQPILETHELSSMCLEYRRECARDSVLESLTAVSGVDVGDIGHGGNIECKHYLRLEDGAEILRGMTEWRPKKAFKLGPMNEAPTMNT